MIAAVGPAGGVPLPPRAGRVLDIVASMAAIATEAELVLIALGAGADWQVAGFSGARLTRPHRVEIEDGLKIGTSTPVRVVRSSSTVWRLEPVPDQTGELPAAVQLAQLAECADGSLVVMLVDRPARRSAASELTELVTAATEGVVVEAALQREMLRESLQEREEERHRWARELHDDTLQELGALQVLLTSADRGPDSTGAAGSGPASSGPAGSGPAGSGVSGSGVSGSGTDESRVNGYRADRSDRSPRAALETAVELVSGQIDSLRHLINELRPAALDELGLRPPLEALAERTERLTGMQVEMNVSLPYADGQVGTRLLPDTELAVYRVVQEALANAARHSGGTRAQVLVVEEEQQIRVEVTDNGAGPGHSVGFGIDGMRERAVLAGGQLQILPRRPGPYETAAAPGGTLVRMVVPALHRAEVARAEAARADAGSGEAGSGDADSAQAGSGEVSSGDADNPQEWA